MVGWDKPNKNMRYIINILFVIVLIGSHWLASFAIYALGTCQ